MRCRTILILLTVPAALASCVSPATSNCAGWRKIQADAATVDWLGAHDPGFLRQVVAHDEFGHARGCWK